jgi:tRNA G37 N-methylase TrmD
MIAQPMIDAVNYIIQKIKKENASSSIDEGSFQIIFPTPSKDVRNQESAHSFSKTENLIFVCGRYE